MIIYFDGSANLIDNKKFSCTYGVTLHAGKENPIESNGRYQLSLSYKSHYELIAFIKAFELIKKNDIDYRKVSFHTDSDLMYYQSVFNDSNYQYERKQGILKNIDQCLKLLDLKEYKDEIIDCIINNRILKIKSHSKTVDNIRADYLAKLAHKNETPLQYQKFLECSFFKYTHDGSLEYNLPFQPTNKNIMIKI